MDEDDIIAALVRRAEGGDAKAAVRLHKMWLAGIRDHGLERYRKWPRDKHRNKIRARPRGRPGASGRCDARGEYIATSTNTGLRDLRNQDADVAASMALQLAFAEGYRSHEAYERAVDILHARTGRVVSASRIKSTDSPAFRALAARLLR